MEIFPRILYFLAVYGIIKPLTLEKINTILIFFRSRRVQKHTQICYSIRFIPNLLELFLEWFLKRSPTLEATGNNSTGQHKIGYFVNFVICRHLWILPSSIEISSKICALNEGHSNTFCKRPLLIDIVLCEIQIM